MCEQTKITKRIYLVTDHQGTPFLVSAYTRNGAVNFIAAMTHKVKVADQRTLVELISSGQKILDVSDVETGEQSCGS